MAGISQHIPNYIKGISRQPDELKMPGQVRDAVNAIPDVTEGLRKRPGARLINPLGFDIRDGINNDPDNDGPLPGRSGTHRSGKWFDFYIDRDESYIGNISTSGIVSIWGTQDGYPRTVIYSDEPQDFSKISDGLPANPACDTDDFVAKRNAVNTTKDRIDVLEATIDKAQTAWDGYSDPPFSGTPAVYETAKFEVIIPDPDWEWDGDDAQDEPDDVKKVVTGYIVESGYIESSKNDEAFVSYNPPEKDADKGRMAVSLGWVKLKKDADKDFLVFGDEVKANIYDWDTEYDDPNAPEISREQLQQFKDELSELSDQLIDEQREYILAAAKCGTNNSPSKKTYDITRADKWDENVLPYLKHFNRSDLQTLTTHDRVLIANRKVAVSLSSEVETVRPPEGYIELKGIAGGRTYEFDVDLLDVDAGFSEMRASKLSINKEVGWTSDENNGTCAFQGTEVFENISSGKGKFLTFEINTTGSSKPKNPDKPEKGYECVYTTSVRLLNGGKGWKVGDKVKVTMNEVDYTVSIKETIEDVVTSEARVSTGVFATNGDEEITGQMILDELKKQTEANSTLSSLGFSCEVVGNGLYLTNNTGLKFACKTSEWDLLNAFGDMVTDITQLPTQCKAGYIVKVANSSASEDDYYVQFYGTGGKPIPDGDITPKGALPDLEKENTPRRNFGVDGPGAWYECVKPGLANIINSLSMPHQIRKVGGKSSAEFIVEPINWADREVGDDFTNPVPRFVTTPVSDDEDPDLRYINNMIFYRSRLCFLTGEAIVLSQPIDNIEHEMVNFWNKTATTLVDTDPIDLIVTSKNPTILYDSIITNSGLLLFSPNHQYLLSTNQDLLSPKTAEINEISAYRYSELTQPISMGTTVAFLSNAGVHSRLFEMTNINRDQQAEVLEQSKIIADLLPNNLNLLAHSKENQVVIAGGYFDDEMFLYRYFNDGVERKQAAWVRWKLTGKLVYQSIIDDTLYIVVSNVFEQPESNAWDVLTLQRVDLKESLWTAIVEDYSFLNEGNREGRYQVHMDNYRVVWPTSLQYYKHLDQTYFRLPLGYFSDKRLAVYTLKYGKFQGRAAYPKIEIDAWGTWAVLDGDWSNTRMMIGYEFEYSVELPVIYPTQSVGNITKSDTACNLTLHRMHLNLGDHGVYETSLKRLGQDDYTQIYEARNEDEYLADDVAFDSAGVQTVPIYCRNTNFGPAPNGIFIKSNHPAPCTLVSMTWEGEYSNNFYKRV